MASDPNFKKERDVDVVLERRTISAIAILIMFSSLLWLIGVFVDPEDEAVYLVMFGTTLILGMIVGMFTAFRGLGGPVSREKPELKPQIVHPTTSNDSSSPSKRGCDRAMSENEQDFPIIANVAIRWRGEAGEVISVQAPVDRGLKIFTITAGAAIAAAMLGLGWMMGTIEATRFFSPALTVISPIVFVPFLLIGSTDYEFLIDKAAGTLTACMRVLWRARFKRETMPFKDVVRIGLEKRSSEGHVDQVFSIVTRRTTYTVVWINTLSKSAMNDLASFLYLQCKEPR